MVCVDIYKLFISHWMWAFRRIYLNIFIIVFIHTLSSLLKKASAIVNIIIPIPMLKKFPKGLDRLMKNHPAKMDTKKYSNLTITPLLMGNILMDTTENYLKVLIRMFN